MTLGLVSRRNKRTKSEILECFEQQQKSEIPTTSAVSTKLGAVAACVSFLPIRVRSNIKPAKSTQQLKL